MALMERPGVEGIRNMSLRDYRAPDDPYMAIDDVKTLLAYMDEWKTHLTVMGAAIEVYEKRLSAVEQELTEARRLLKTGVGCSATYEPKVCRGCEDVEVCAFLGEES